MASASGIKYVSSNPGLPQPQIWKPNFSSENTLSDFISTHLAIFHTYIMQDKDKWRDILSCFDNFKD